MSASRDSNQKETMPGRVVSHMAISVDGFIARPIREDEELFNWHAGDDTGVPGSGATITIGLDYRGQRWRNMTNSVGADRVGALVVGRRLFDTAGGWNDNHSVGVPVVVVTHRAPPDAANRWPRTAFIDQVGPAILRARSLARGRDVVIISASITQQALDLDLIDELHLSLLPIVFGRGIPYFTTLHRGDLILDDPIVVQGRRVLELRYRVRHAAFPSTESADRYPYRS